MLTAQSLIAWGSFELDFLSSCRCQKPDHEAELLQQGSSRPLSSQWGVFLGSLNLAGNVLEGWGQGELTVKMLAECLQHRRHPQEVVPLSLCTDHYNINIKLLASKEG